ncbi:hypothetical protein LUZ61_003152 [Rhynchospora tenuis]|uniref:Protein kinase domain-containing protein n=1 Tax=Rhynchospora tenuis TaxID=198213 RepID=A0AAD6ESE9_9POAL|nr:hypothetical protein LUZ61_003152 [Rhynchospora tenuis]
MQPMKGSYFLTCILISVFSTCVISFIPIDNYLIDCGSSRNTAVGPRFFLGDSNLPSRTLSTPTHIMASTHSKLGGSSEYPSLYQTARIFTSPSYYSFQIQQQGHHFIRLHFYPFVYQNYDLANAKFNVSTQDIMLLTDFQLKNVSSPILKEYLVNITKDKLIICFQPFSDLAFVNAIEVISVPENLIFDKAYTINPLGQYTGLSTQALENVYRVNMGMSKVTPDNDTLWRTWVPDASFIQNQNFARWKSTWTRLNYMQGLVTAETAPPIVYNSATELALLNETTTGAQFNITWQFELQEGYTYMLRFHFCDIVSNSANQLLFNVYVGPWAVLTDFDLSSLTYGSLATPLFTDFILSAKDTTSKLSISIGPSKIANVQPHGILNGLEIFKFNNISSTSFITNDAGSTGSLVIALGIIVGAMISFVIIVLVGKMRLEKKRSFKMHRRSTINNTVLCHNRYLRYRFMLLELQEATHNFDENWVIGVGGFGKVYNGVLRDGTQVAVKRGKTNSQQGINEFRNEIELLSRIWHQHLLTLVGYCDEKKEMILVYEYMEKGTLKSHLYGSDLPPLTWKQRLEICIGSARGLNYLHKELVKPIIHRDVKSANILLDQHLIPKIADFGLSKSGPGLDQSPISTAVKGTFGYLDPEYFRFQQLTVKSDVYSFGVVLLEVLCARPVINPSLSGQIINIVDWAMGYLRRGELIQVVDHQIAASIQSDSLRKFGEIVEKCLADDGCERPSMAVVVWYLEYALQLQEMEPDPSGVNSLNLIARVSDEIEPFLGSSSMKSLD